MSARNHNSLKTVAAIATVAERQSALELAESYKRLNKQLEQLDQLQAFRQDYAGEAHQRGTSGLSVQKWQRYEDFVQGIDEVIERQEHDLKNTHTLIKTKQRSWQKANQKSTMIHDVVERGERHVKQIRERRQQTEIDDQSFRSRWRRRP